MEEDVSLLPSVSFVASCKYTAGSSESGSSILYSDASSGGKQRRIGLAHPNSCQPNDLQT